MDAVSNVFISKNKRKKGCFIINIHTGQNSKAKKNIPNLNLNR